MKTAVRWISGRHCEDGEWMELVQDRVQWRALVLMMLNFEFCYCNVR